MYAWRCHPDQSASPIPNRIRRRRRWPACLRRPGQRSGPAVQSAGVEDALRLERLVSGGHVGYGGGSFGQAPIRFPSRASCLQRHRPDGGYRRATAGSLSSGVFLGIEADASFTGPLDVVAVSDAPFHTTIDYVGTVRGRMGYAFGTLLPYVTGGLA